MVLKIYESDGTITEYYLDASWGSRFTLKMLEIFHVVNELNNNKHHLEVFFKDNIEGKNVVKVELIISDLIQTLQNIGSQVYGIYFEKNDTIQDNQVIERLRFYHR